MNERSIAMWCAPVLALVLATSPAAGQQSDEEWLRQCQRQSDRSDRAIVCQVRPVSTRLVAGGLSVDAGQNGGISVHGSAGTAEVQASVRVQARAATEARAWEIADAVRVNTGGGELRAQGLMTTGEESWHVSFAVTVPRQANLDLRTVNGPLAVSDVAGRIRAVTTNGPLSLQDVAGNVHARAENGPLTVRLSGTRWEGAGLDAETRNGPVSLAVPDGYSAELHMGTINGPLSGFPAVSPTSLPRRGGHIQTTLGSGGAPVRVVTTNGPASFRVRE